MTWNWILKFAVGYLVGSVLFVLLEVWIIKRWKP